MSLRIFLPRCSSGFAVRAVFAATALLSLTAACLPAQAQTIITGRRNPPTGPGSGSPGIIVNNPPITNQSPRQIITNPPIQRYQPPQQIQNYPPPQGNNPYYPQQPILPPMQINRYDPNRLPIMPPTQYNPPGNGYPTRDRTYDNFPTRRGTTPNAPNGIDPNGIIARGPRNPNPERNISNRNGREIFTHGPTRVTTPDGPRNWRGRHDHDDYFYPGGTTVVLGDGQIALLGGYYYGNYCDVDYGPGTYPSIYYDYTGFPEYIYSPSVIVVPEPYYPVYDTGYLPFYTPVYQVTYNQTNYYVASQQRVNQLEQGGAAAHTALKYAFPSGSYQAAFGDIALAWTDGNVTPLRKHIRDNDTKIGVSLNTKYSYSIASSDYLQITRDALDRLKTDSFEFTRVRKAKNGDVTAYGKHVYHTGDGDSASTDDNSGSTGTTDNATTDNTVPFDQTTPYSQTDDSSAGEQKTIYVSYTLRHSGDQWYIIAIDSSTKPLVK